MLASARRRRRHHFVIYFIGRVDNTTRKDYAIIYLDATVYMPYTAAVGLLCAYGPKCTHPAERMR